MYINKHVDAALCRLAASAHAVSSDTWKHSSVVQYLSVWMHASLVHGYKCAWLPEWCMACAQLLHFMPFLCRKKVFSWCDGFGGCDLSIRSHIISKNGILKFFWWRGADAVVGRSSSSSSASVFLLCVPSSSSDLALSAFVCSVIYNTADSCLIEENAIYIGTEFASSSFASAFLASFVPSVDPSMAFLATCRRGWCVSRRLALSADSDLYSMQSFTKQEHQFPALPLLRCSRDAAQLWSGKGILLLTASASPPPPSSPSLFLIHLSFFLILFYTSSYSLLSHSLHSFNVHLSPLIIPFLLFFRPL